MEGLADMLPDYDPPVISTGMQLPPSLQPTVCPVCIGNELCKKQQALQAAYLLTSMTDVGAVVEFQGELNLRRCDELGYSFKQFDEREWGMHFEDMRSEDESEAGGDDYRFEHWAEAMDPSSGSVKTRPASATTIAALPRKSFTDAQLAEGTECQVCKEDFAYDSVLVQLPCGHVHFNEDCIATWLLQFDTCPDCRKQVPAAAEPQVATDEVMQEESEDKDAVMFDE
ncbi:hypothetical protein DOTSEDRAFT_71155 [Dothistroma septosporum NZE10]|uniref:RING-type domain-containing protein n=1 Tax=Dothistroma septosporum (strain NZE10 / CBS 128990) TaxID=675120 RepID=N1PQW4_DOTSN|nr:hypothetical protein DOTSEDRAFT_71155 [Dothistroma septosporum NZE10]